jgi:energy-coupling factor transporter ATP-binding protein EcfA2
MSDPIGLTLRAVRHRYPTAPRDTPPATDLTLEPGARALLTGPNGSGKSTLLRRIVGLLAGPGEIQVGDLTVARPVLRLVRRRVGFLWQNPDDALLLPTTLDDVAFGPLNDSRSPADASATAREWLERLGIGHLADHAVRTLSLGEKQLVSLAGVLARGPGLLLLDEPTSFLDQEARDRLSDILSALPATMLLVTHDPKTWVARGWTEACDLTPPPPAAR